ncbi:Protein kinase superfamily protein [Prunus dulcis]|uniref:Protein kinase superfamily protein n=1 Tax=Prunus dulcis TaxID=3755 RepID=A0A4Y1QVH4_PRUDU|nr:Protein kinase superfamily protein [Prunus dulcis]
MPNGSLYDLLHLNSRPPGWTRRIRFGLHVAKAVQGLHSSSPPVIHRDIKSSNVLIDKDWNARLGDLGLALRGHVEDVRIKCTPPAGTLGYLDPGYLSPGDLSAKSDVFSFGILLLEILSGRNAIDVNYSPPSVVDWAVPIIKRGDFAGICDQRIGPPADPP